MEIYFGNKGINNYIEVCINNNELNKKEFVLRMLDNNDIEGLIDPVVSRIDNSIYLRYNINSFFVLEKYFIKAKPDIEVLVKIVADICGLIKNAESYLLDINDIVVDKNFIMWNEKSKKIELIYAPGFKKDIRRQIKEFMEYIMRVFDYKDTDGVVKMHMIYEVVSSEVFDLKELEGCIEGMNKKAATSIKCIEKYEIPDNTCPAIYNINDEAADDEKDISENDNNIHEIILSVNTALLISGILGYLILKNKLILIIFILTAICLLVNLTIYMIKKENENDIDMDEAMRDFKDNTYFDIENNSEKYVEERPDFKEKINIEEKKDKDIKLVPLNDGMVEPFIIDISKPEFIIGRGKHETDYRLNKEQVSRVHACFTVKNMEIYIEDKNSTNGTYVNSVKLEAFKKSKINKGDIISFANEEFFVT